MLFLGLSTALDLCPLPVVKSESANPVVINVWLEFAQVLPTTSAGKQAIDFDELLRAELNISDAHQ